MNILAIDTSTEACSAAIWRGKLLARRYTVQAQGHSALILGMCEDVLNEAKLTLKDIDFIAFGRGPGSFTGLRIGTGVAQGLAFAVDIPVVPVSSLAAIAQAGFNRSGHRQILSAIDARMSEVYFAEYAIDTNDIATLVGDESLRSPGDLPSLSKKNYLAVGSAWEAYPELLTGCQPVVNQVAADILVDAAAIAQLAEVAALNGQSVSAEDAQPIYLRDNVAQKSQQR